ncbi:natriuretic peptide A-like [Pangasianodon hypophthalmus]|uniref:natriuretic peptide A-like n=1 Tax=Pangasianodon hypophthalmus TaxID=310915 RepID=UPI000EFF81B7|nr:natriuretic peptide A-like [Pangasianodon hypophthalmus]
MTANFCVFCLSSLLLLNFIGAKPLSELQESLKELLEEEQTANAPFLGPEVSESASQSQSESESERGGGTAERRALSGSAWSVGEISGALAAKENALDRLIGDILSVSKRSRFKKGGLRSCFGVRLERIGSFSGLGC